MDTSSSARRTIKPLEKNAGGEVDMSQATSLPQGLDEEDILESNAGQMRKD